MKTTIYSTMVLLFFSTVAFSQGFKVKASGEQTFNFADKNGRNQATFFSATPLEDINGLTNNITGNVSFNVNDLKTLKGSISVSVATIKTGIDLRDEHLRSENWLNASSYPEITFKIKSVGDIKSMGDNKLQAKVVGDFTLHGVTKETTADVILTFLDQSEETKKRAAGDLLGVRADFKVKLSEFGVKNNLIGQKVAEVVEIGVNMVGSNAN